MEQAGIILEVHSGTAKVRFSQHGSCEHCGACGGNQASVLEVRNEIEAQPGQRVMVNIEQTGLVKAAFIVYMLPLIAAFVGAFIGYWLSEANQWGLSIASAVMGAVILVGLAVLYIRVFDRKSSARDRMPRITKIIN